VKETAERSKKHEHESSSKKKHQDIFRSLPNNSESSQEEAVPQELLKKKSNAKRTWYQESQKSPEEDVSESKSGSKRRPLSAGEGAVPAALSVTPSVPVLCVPCSRQNSQRSPRV
jgi:hypothetical protein